MLFYDISRIEAENAYYNVIFGGRSSGKSDAMARLLVDSYFRTGEEFGRVLRYITDNNGMIMEGYFNSDHLRTYIREKYDRQIIYNGVYWYAVPADEEDPHDKKLPRQRIGQTFILNHEYRYKSSQFDEITRLLNEEFILMDPADYLAFEFEKYMSLVSTINRHRDNLKCYFIGNTLNKANPYFSGLGINLEKLNIYPGQIRTMHNRHGVKYAIEYAEMSYRNLDEIPMILKIDGNEIATEGDFVTDPNVYPPEMIDKIMSRGDPVYLCSLLYRALEYRVYKIRITDRVTGFCIIRRWEKYGGKNKTLIRLDNRLIDIDPVSGGTLDYLLQFGFDTRTTVFDDDEIKYAIITALRHWKNFV